MTIWWTLTASELQTTSGPFPAKPPTRCAVCVSAGPGEREREFVAVEEEKAEGHTRAVGGEREKEAVGGATGQDSLSWSRAISE